MAREKLVRMCARNSSLNFVGNIAICIEGQVQLEKLPLVLPGFESDGFQVLMTFLLIVS